MTEKEYKGLTRRTAILQVKNYAGEPLERFILYIVYEVSDDYLHAHWWPSGRYKTRFNASVFTKEQALNMFTVAHYQNFD